MKFSMLAFISLFALYVYADRLPPEEPIGHYNPYPELNFPGDIPPSEDGEDGIFIDGSLHILVPKLISLITKALVDLAKEYVKNKVTLLPGVKYMAERVKIISIGGRFEIVASLRTFNAHLPNIDIKSWRSCLPYIPVQKAYFVKEEFLKMIREQANTLRKKGAASFFHYSSFLGVGYYIRKVLQREGPNPHFILLNMHHKTDMYSKHVCVTHRRKLQSDDKLSAGSIYSTNSIQKLTLQGCDLTLYVDLDAVWMTKTGEGAFCKLELTKEGNLVLCAANHGQCEHTLWETDTTCTDPSSCNLVVGNDGHLTLSDHNGPLFEVQL